MHLSAPQLLLDTKAFLGEGPTWDNSRQLLYWLDVFAGHLHLYDPLSGDDQLHELGKMVGCMAPARSGKVLLGLQDGLATLELSSGSLTYLAQPEKELPGNRFNDGKCDPAGRFLAGTMDHAEEETTGSLYSLSPGGTLKTLIGNVAISNGLAWSPDYKTLYFIDTPTHNVMAYDYDVERGEIDNARVAVTVPAELGWPDGMTSDTKGRLWVALWGGAALSVWEPGHGRLLECIPVPAKNVSSCTFGGPEHNQLYVTSARKGVSEADLTSYPLTGGLFRLQTDVEGMPTFQFAD